MLVCEENKKISALKATNQELKAHKMGKFWKDFKRGFKIGWNGTKKVASYIPVVNEAAKVLPKLHKSGHVPKTGNYRLRKGEVVMNKTQLTRLKTAKSAKGKQKVITPPCRGDARRK